MPIRSPRLVTLAIVAGILVSLPVTAEEKGKDESGTAIETSVAEGHRIKTKDGTSTSMRGAGSRSTTVSSSTGPRPARSPIRSS